MNWAVFALIVLGSIGFLYPPGTADEELRHLECAALKWFAVMGLIWLLRL